MDNRKAKYHKNRSQSCIGTGNDAPDLFSAAITFAGINLMWVFFALWVAFGIVPVLLLAVFLNHLINRVELRLQQGPT